MKKIKYVFVIALLFTAVAAVAQKSVVKGKPTIQDRFPKRMGNLYFSKSVVQLKTILDNDIKTDTVFFYNASKDKMTLETGNVPQHIQVKLSDNSLKEKEEGYIIVTFDAAKKKDYGNLLDRVIINTNDTLMPKKMIGITTVIEPYFAPMTAEDSAKAPKIKTTDLVFNFDTITAGDTVTRSVTFTNTGENELKFLAVKSQCGCVKVAPLNKKALAKGEEQKLQFTFNSLGMEGASSQKIIIYTNSLFNSKLEIVMKGVVIKPN